MAQSPARTEDKCPKLTEEQHTEMLLVFGWINSKRNDHCPSWDEVFNWVKARWPTALSCPSYDYIYTRWKERGVDHEGNRLTDPHDPRAAEDMGVLMEIHDWHRSNDHGYPESERTH